jgi:hypothetical protein
LTFINVVNGSLVNADVVTKDTVSVDDKVDNATGVVLVMAG